MTDPEMDLDGFDVFDRSSAPSPSVPTLTIQRRGMLSLNRGSYEALGKPAAVELLFNRERRAIAIRPADPATPRAYAVRAQGAAGGSSSTYLVPGRSFTTHYGIDTTVARRYGVERRGEMLLVDLEQEGAVTVTSPRAKDREAPTRESVAAVA